MDPLDQGQARLKYLEEAAEAADGRLGELRNMRTRNEGALAALEALDGQMEGHRRALLKPAAPVDPDHQPKLDAQICGLQDGMAFLRAARRAEESQGFVLYGQELEAAAQRRQLAEHAKQGAVRLQTLLAELERGVARQDLGRPAPQGAVRADIEARRQQADDKREQAERKRREAAGRKAAQAQLKRRGVAQEE